MDNVDLLPPTLTHDHRVYSKELTEEDETKEEENRRMETRPNSNTWQLDALSPRDVKILIQAEEELSQTKLFQRIWPTNSTHEYFKYFEALPYSEKLMETYESVYGKKREEGQALLADYCHKKVHLQLPKPESLLKGHLPKPVEDKPKKHCGEGNSRVLIPNAFLRRW